MLRVIASEDLEKVKKQIEALEWQIKQDTNEKDRAIHQQALAELKKRGFIRVNFNS